MNIKVAAFTVSEKSNYIGFSQTKRDKYRNLLYPLKMSLFGFNSQAYGRLITLPR